jgi:hypothetical protein
MILIKITVNECLPSLGVYLLPIRSFTFLAAIIIYSLEFSLDSITNNCTNTTNSTKEVQAPIV